MTVPNNVNVGEDGARFRLSWVGPVHAHGYLVSAARDSEFTVDRRCFYIPPVGASGVSLDMGGGAWFFRVATIAGGRIRWCNTYGPYVNSAAHGRPAPPAGTNDFTLLHTRSIKDGLRAHVDYARSAYIMIIEAARISTAGGTSASASMRASDTVWTYAEDTVHRGSVDVLNLEHPHNYAVRCTLLDGAVFPSDRIVPLGPGLRFQGTPDRPIRHADNTLQSLHRGDVAVLRRAENEPNISFSSHADYLRYQAARARAGIDAVRRSPASSSIRPL
jgi:hypothetical protein